MAWSEFLWLANPLNYKSCLDPGDPGARKAVWSGGNPFMVSALVIDQFVRNYGPDTLAQLGRRVVEVCPWFGPQDRTPALAAIEAAFDASPSNPTIVGEQPDLLPAIRTFGDLLDDVR